MNQELLTKATAEIIELNYCSPWASVKVAEAVLRVAIEACAEICLRRSARVVENERDEEAEACAEEIRALLT